MQAIWSVFLITLGLGQTISTVKGWWAASLVGPSRLAGYGLGILLVVVGALMLPDTWLVLWWTLLAGPLALGLLLLGGSFIAPPPHPNQLFTTNHPAHAGCYPVQIPDGDYLMPGFLLVPPPSREKKGLAVCIVPGAGDNKISFKWRLVQAMLAAGLTVLTIDTPGHGDYRQRPMAYPDCLSAVPAALRFLRAQPGIKRIGVAGISLGGALALRSIAENQASKTNGGRQVDALVVLETPVQLNYNRTLFYREAWTTYRAPVLSVLREISIKQIIQSWYTGGYRSQHSTSELFDLLNPLESVSLIKEIPILLVYSDRDPIAPPEAAQAMLQAASQADILTSRKASHVTLTLMPDINRQVAHWLGAQLSNSTDP